MIAAPVLEHAGPARVVDGPYAELEDGFVVALIRPGVPMMPNGMSVARLPAPGTVVRVGGAPVWDPVPRATVRPPLSGDPRVEAFAAALAARDAPAAAAEARKLIGRGQGLTPEGDDLLAGALATSAVLHGALEGVLPPDLRARTTKLSATLLELAAGGAVMEPVHGLFTHEWRRALHRLQRVGHSTGRAYAAGAGAVLSRAA